MSTHALGNVQLITVQEVEAMLDEAIVPEASIDAKVAAETTAREAADTALTEKITAVTEKITTVKQMEEATDSNFSFTRFKDLPIAVLNFDTSSIIFKISELGNTITTVPNRYLPKYPVDFVTSAQISIDTDSSSVTNSICPVVLNLDIHGNVKFVNVLPMDATHYNAVNTGSATVTYITKE